MVDHTSDVRVSNSCRWHEELFIILKMKDISGPNFPRRLLCDRDRKIVV
jgi:hypothetical protein